MIELFKEIDVNNDGDLQWDEFTNHIVELGKEKKDSAYVESFKEYYPSSIRDGKHDKEIEKMVYCSKMKEKHLIVLERDSKKYKVYNSRTGKVYPEFPSGKMTGVMGSFIAAEYIDFPGKRHGLLATTSSDNCIRFWETQNYTCLLYTSPSPRDRQKSRMPSSA